MSEEIKFNFDDRFQLGIFELMMMDTSFCEKACSLLKGEYFKNHIYAWFFEKNKELIEKYGSAPTHLQIRNEIMRFGIEKRDTYLQVFKKITTPDKPRDYPYIRDNLQDFCKKAVMFQMNELLIKNQSNDPDYTLGLIQKKVEEINSVSFGKAECQTLGQLTTIMQRSAEASKDLIPTYMPRIDYALGGGIQKGTLTLGLSGTNVGKSFWLINWAYHLIKDGYKVFYVNLEGYEDQTILRLAARAIGASFKKVKWNELTDIELQKKNAFEEKYKDMIQIYHDSSFGFTLEDLIPIARQKKEEFNYDVMIVDYGQILGAKKKFNELRHEQTYVHRALNSIAGKKDLDCAVITVAQGNRETQEKNNKGNTLIRMNDIAECFEIIRCCATVITFNRSNQDIEMDTVRALLDKSRDGRTNVIEVMKTNLDRCAFFGSAEEGLGFMKMDDYITQVGK